MPWQIDVINDLMLLTAKPVTYLVNLSERDYIRKKNKWLPKIKAWIDENAPGDLLIPFSVALEERLAMEFADDPKALTAELEKIGTQSQIGKIMKIGYQSLNVRSMFLFLWSSLRQKRGLTASPLPPRSFSLSLVQLIHYFTCGPDEVRAWTIRSGLPAPKAAGVIQCVVPSSLSSPGVLKTALTMVRAKHRSTDFEKNFVCGEIMSFEDLKEYKSETAVKAVRRPSPLLSSRASSECSMTDTDAAQSPTRQAGKQAQKGKTYEVMDGDICYWKAG